MDRLEDVEHARFRALAQLLIDAGGENHDQGIEAFEDYMKKAFPGRESKQRKKKEQTLEMLKWWVNRGALGVTAMPEFAKKKGKSRMVHRVQRVDTGRGNTVYRQLGKRP